MAERTPPPSPKRPRGAARFENSSTPYVPALGHEAIAEALVLRVVDAAGAPATIELGAAPLVIGSGVDCDIVLRDKAVSRRHAEIYAVPGGAVVRDLGSRNGTTYLGQRVERITLGAGSRFRVASITLAIEPALSQDDIPPSEHDAYRGLTGQSQKMRRIFALLGRLERSLATVLVTGQTGVGKDVIATAIHEGSRVASGPLVPVNCGAIPRELIQSELFGHVRGAFTGALDNRVGAFQRADGGTLFLDEVGELPLELQPVLLRVLETGELLPVGAREPSKATVRVVAATNVDLEQRVRDGRFREDLYYRLAVVQLRVPPLDERPDDIEALAARFAESAGIGALPERIIASFTSRSWPGNARQLRNAVDSYAALGVIVDPTSNATSPTEGHFPSAIDTTIPYADQKQLLIDRFTKLYLEQLLRDSKNNRSEASRRSGIDRAHLVRMLARAGLSERKDEE